MASQRENLWLRNAPNELIVNSILAAVATIVIQIIVGTEHKKFGTEWVVIAFGSLFLFVLSAERLSESIREVDFRYYRLSMILYNLGVLTLFFSLYAIFRRYAHLKAVGSVVSVTAVSFLWMSFWGRDTLFLIFRNEHYDKWERKMEGDLTAEEILDHVDIFIKICRERFGKHQDPR
jgi:hypothetical protein